MAMHRSFRNDVDHPPGQVVRQGKPLEQEIEEYLAQEERKQVDKMCRCNDDPPEQCLTCPNRS